MKTGCYGWGLHRKKHNDLETIRKEPCTSPTFLSDASSILLRIQLLSHRQLAKRNVHKDFPIGNIHKSDDDNHYYLHSTSYLLQKCQVSYCALFLII